MRKNFLLFWKHRKHENFIEVDKSKLRFGGENSPKRKDSKKFNSK